MKAVNVVLSILILLLAAASAVFSYFLFEKRDQMVEGWRKMASQIHQTATELDKNSGTTVAKELTPEILSHENYAELDQNIRKLSEQSVRIIRQRNELADALQHIGASAEAASKPSSEALRDLATYGTNRNDVINAVGDLVTRRDLLARTIRQTAKENFNLDINENKVKAGDNTEIAKFNNRLKQAGQERKDLETAMNTISGQAGTGKLDFSGNNFKASVDKATKGVRDLKSSLDAANNTINSKNQEIQRHLSEIENQKNQIAGLNKTLTDKNNQLNGLKSALGIPDEEMLPVPWLAGSPEARRMILGRVSEVNTRYGYIAINLGSETTVTQQLGNKTAEINIGMMPGLEMVVSRGELDVPTAQFITRVRTTRVDEECTIAEPCGEQAKQVRVGDYVWFDIPSAPVITMIH